MDSIGKRSEAAFSEPLPATRFSQAAEITEGVATTVWIRLWNLPSLYCLRTRVSRSGLEMDLVALGRSGTSDREEMLHLRVEEMQTLVYE